MGSFTKWVKTKLDDVGRIELLQDIIETIEDDEKAALVAQLIDELNEDGYDWGDDSPEGNAPTAPAAPAPAPSLEPTDGCRCYDCKQVFKRSEVRPRGTAYICIPCDDALNTLPTEED